jgi:hypothetical protein
MVGKDASMTTPQPAPPHDHQPEPTPDQDGLVAAIAAVLLVGASLGLTAAALAALLRRRGFTISTRSLLLALKLASARTKHQPRMIGRTDVARAQQGMEAHYRAAYVLNAAGRLEAAKQAALAELEFRAVQDHRELTAAERDKAEAAAYSAAMQRERSYELAHERARRRRMEAAVQVAEAANRWGVILGWHTHRDDRTTPECYAAHGTNFRADIPPVIGWPGTLHGGTCRCRAGRPFRGAVTTDDATGFGPRRTA